MDDGYKSTTGFYISTESYSLDDNLFLARVLLNKFDLQATAHKTTNGYRLYIPSKSISRFTELVEPYILAHFKYKLDLQK